MAKKAIILHEGTLGSKEVLLSRILDFFGVPWDVQDVFGPATLDVSPLEYVMFGSINAVAVLKQRRRASLPESRPAAFYTYADDDHAVGTYALQSLFGDPNLSLQEGPAGKLLLTISNSVTDITGAMGGLQVRLQLGVGRGVLIGTPTGQNSMFQTIISVGDIPVFVRFQNKGTPFYFCASRQIVDIDRPVGRIFYDIKDHFCSVVPLIMFIRFAFREVVWQPQELGACLIIDDPLLKPQYGFCNFQKLRDLMRQHGFTTNIAFIPWNWRRTSLSAGRFFKCESKAFSVSIHGCDHTAGEFGTNSLRILSTRAQLAQSRMRNHQLRTGIEHDPIMVFPQGVFSSACPTVLKRNGFLAAVNTEIAPTDPGADCTRIRDVWDVAIMRYGSFPIFTRRYAFHGLENFAFDLLLGKPCLIVIHHDFLKDGGTGLVDFIEKIKGLNCCLHWRPLGEVLRRACRRRSNGVDTNGVRVEHVEMYANELLIDNPSCQAIAVQIRKRISKDHVVSKILCDEKPLKWTADSGYGIFGDVVPSQCERSFRVAYREQSDVKMVHRSLRLELGVAARRILCEVRDNYLSRSSILMTHISRLKSAFRKTV
jgi:hypothetical protein